MTTAQVLFEQYKVLPKRIQQQFKKLIVEADQPAARPAAPATDDEEDTDTHVSISLEALHSSIEQVKMLKAGKLQTQDALTMLAEVQAELDAEDVAKDKQVKQVA